MELSKIDGNINGTNHGMRVRPPNFQENVFSYTSEYCGATSIHGVQYLGEKGRLLVEKFLWCVVLAVFWTICIILILKTYTKWKTSPVILSFSTTETSIADIPFPAITVCPLAKFNAGKFNFTELAFKKRDSGISEDEQDILDILALVCDTSDMLFSKFVDVWNKTITEKQLSKIAELAIPIFLGNEIPPLLMFKSEKLIKLEGSRFVYTELGLCYTYNSKPWSEILKYSKNFVVNLPKFYDEFAESNATVDDGPKRVFSVGKDDGFWLIAATWDSFLDNTCTSGLHGFRVILHNPSEFPNIDDNVPLALNSVTNVEVHPKIIGVSQALRSYTHEKRKCYFPDERDLKYYKHYTQNHCLMECFSNYSEKHCNCVDFHRPKLPETPICGFGAQKCLHEFEALFSKEELDKCECLPSCESLQYTAGITQETFVTSGYKTAINCFLNDNKLKGDYMSPSLSVMYVYYNEMQHQTLERGELFGFVDFISNIGGLLGLFLGFSMTSIVEILYFLSLRIVSNVIQYGKQFWAGKDVVVNEGKNR